MILLRPKEKKSKRENESVFSKSQSVRMDQEEVRKSKVSGFYIACRTNAIETVKKFLEEHSNEELDCVESNDSTALHAACYNNFPEVVTLLLERGFTRRVTNLYNHTPYEEAAKYPHILQLFSRPNIWKRFGGADTDAETEKSRWFVLQNNETRINVELMSEIYEGNRLACRAFHYEKILNQYGENLQRISAIRRLFRLAFEEKDCGRLIQAYTVDSDLPDRINNYLVERFDKKIKLFNEPADIIMQFVETIHQNVELHNQYRFTGKCYRLLKIGSDQDFDFFPRGKKVVNKTLISATKDPLVLENYIESHREHGQYMVLISFDIRERKSALDIESLSEFPLEKEVLIMTNRVFKVIDVRLKNSFDVAIDLAE